LVLHRGNYRRERESEKVIPVEIQRQIKWRKKKQQQM
jgi:hypothetical protein